MSLYERIVDDLHKLGYQFRVNDLTEAIEIKEGDKGWQRISEILEAKIRTKLRDNGYGRKGKPLMAVRDAFITLADENRYNPIKDYFKSLEGRYEPYHNGPYKNHTISGYFDNPDRQFSRWLFLWMVGQIAKVFECERMPMLVLAGGQNIGKSYFVSWLCPLPDHLRKGSINPDRIDDTMRLADTLIWEVEELGATTRRADIEALKGFITRPFIDDRAAYGHYKIRKPAICGFIGTVNPDGAGFLNDPTGSTRFLTCEVDGIDFGYTAMPVDELWSEAWWYYNNVKGCWKLTKADEATQGQLNASFQVAMFLEDVVELRLEVTGDPNDFMTTQAIKMHLTGHHSISNDQHFYNELARVLKKRGLTKGRSSFQPGKPHLAGWYGLKKRHEDKLF